MNSQLFLMAIVIMLISPTDRCFQQNQKYTENHPTNISTEIIEQPQNKTAEIGDKVILNCKFKSKVDCAWRRNNSHTPYSNSQRGIIYTRGKQTRDCSLIIPEVEINDFTNWQCYEINTEIESNHSNPIWISERKKPTDPVIKFNNNTIQGTSLNLTCEPYLLNLTCISKYGNPVPRLYWKFNGKTINGTSEYLTHAENNYTTILKWNLSEYRAEHFNSSNLQCCLNHVSNLALRCTKTFHLNRRKYKSNHLILQNGQPTNRIYTYTKANVNPLENVTCLYNCCSTLKFTLHWKLSSKEFNGLPQDSNDDCNNKIIWNKSIELEQFINEAKLECIATQLSLNISYTTTVTLVWDEIIQGTSTNVLTVGISVAVVIITLSLLFGIFKWRKKRMYAYKPYNNIDSGQIELANLQSDATTSYS